MCTRIALALCCCGLLLAAPTARAAVVTVDAQHVLRIDGAPFLPIMQFAQCKWRIAEQRTFGINTFVGNGCSGDTNAQFLDECQAQGVWGVVDSSDLGLASHQALLGWLFGDEPDLDSNQVAPSAIQTEYTAIKAADPDHVTLLTLTAGFFSQMDPPSWMGGNRDRYHDYAAASDLVGFDIYPVYGWCQPDWLGYVGAAQTELATVYAPTRATYQWIECSGESGQWCELCSRCSNSPATCDRDNPCPDDGPTPAEVRNEVWQAIVHGATAIGYFTHAWECPAYTQWCVSDPLKAELTRTNGQLTALTHQILGPHHAGAIAVTALDGGQIDFKATVSRTTVHIFAVNVRDQTERVRFTVDGLTGPVVDYETAQQITPVGTAFDDSFEPLAVKIYIASLARPTLDGGAIDTGRDAAAADAVVRDSPVTDMAIADVAAVDASRRDGSGGELRADIAAVPDAVSTRIVPAGCACRASPHPASALVSALLLLAFARRRGMTGRPR